jgi:hypothetical protein
MVMNVSNAWFSSIPVRFAERDYMVVHGTWPDGSAALLLQNVQTNALLPISRPYGFLPRAANEVFIVDDVKLIAALEDASVIRPTSQSHTPDRDKVRLCHVVHPELVRRADLNAHSQNGRGTGEQEMVRNRENSRER